MCINLTVLTLFTVLGAFENSISNGLWSQTASTAGEDDNVAIEVKSFTLHIITLEYNNGWVGYGWHDDEKNLYTGFFELTMVEIDNDMEN